MQKSDNIIKFWYIFTFLDYWIYKNRIGLPPFYVFFYILEFYNIQSVQGGKVNILGGYSIGHSKQKILYEHVSYSQRFPRQSHLNANRKIVDKKEILRVRTVSNTGIYCSSDIVSTVYNKCSKIHAAHRFTCFRQWRSRAGGKDNIGRPSQTTIQSNVSISENIRSRTHVHIKFFA